MADIAVQHLHLRGPPERSAVAAFRIEDALRTEVGEDRLVLVRRLHVGRLPTGDRSRALSDRLGSAWRGVRDGSVHGDADRAAEANCVWFADAAEARRLLARRIARGQKTDAWYWRLAVPDWRGESAEDWITGQIARALASGDARGVLALVEALIEASAIGPLIHAFLALAGTTDNVGEAPAPFGSAPPPSERRPASPLSSDILAAGLDEPGEHLPVQAARIARLIARLPSQLRAVLARLSVMAQPARSALRLIGEALILRRWPELRLAPSVLAAAVEEWSIQLANPSRHAAALDARQISRRKPLSQAASSPAPAGPAVDVRGPGPGTFANSRQDFAVTRPVRPSRPELPSPFPDTALTVEQFTPAAGLLLAVIPLIELGWREWLAGRPDLLGTAPGPRLLDTIAAHHRVRADDPVRRLFDIDPGDGADWPALWRVGLDRWLKRRARLKLHQLVWRRGWVTRSDDALFIRFPLDSADIRLRRLALDRDPGWVDWLGLSVRYAYRDTPGLGQRQ